MASLSLGEILLLAETAVSLLLARISLPFLSHRNLRRLRDDHRIPTNPQRPHDIGNTPATIGWAARVMASRLPGKNTCLVQAVAVHAMLRRRGYTSTLRIGVSGKDPGGFIKAHAWVECQGRVVVGDLEDLTAYSVLSAPNAS